MKRVLCLAIALPQSWKTCRGSFALPGYDLDENPLVYTIVQGPSHGTLTGNTLNVMYSPDPDAGSDSISFIVSDGLLPSETGTVTFTVWGLTLCPLHMGRPCK